MDCCPETWTPYSISLSAPPLTPGTRSFDWWGTRGPERLVIPISQNPSDNSHEKVAVVCVELQFHFTVTRKEFWHCLGSGPWEPGGQWVTLWTLAPAGSLVVQTLCPKTASHTLISWFRWGFRPGESILLYFFPMEREQAGKQQIIKLMSTFIAVKAVKASHGFLIKSHQAYLQSHTIFLVIQPRNCLWNSMCSAQSFMTLRLGGGKWGEQGEGGGAHQTSWWGWREPCLFGFVWFIDSGKMPFGHYPKGQKLQFWHFVGKRQGTLCLGCRTQQCSFHCP